MVLAAAGAPLALGAMATAITRLYGIASDINRYIDSHIEDMKGSSNPTVARTGRILDGAKCGFGLGYISSVTIIAAGQYLLGNTLAAVSTVATAATLSNPIAMTCAAVGAILYGWHALSDGERNDLLDKLARGLEIGVELIKSIIGFVIQTAKNLFDSQRLKDFKTYIADKAALFGRSLSDVTRQTVDVVNDAALTVKKHADAALTSTVKAAGNVSARVGDAFSELGKAASGVMTQTGEAAQQVIQGGKDVIQRARSDRQPK